MRTFICLLFSLSVICSFAQTTESISFDNLTREYIEYVPEIYNPDVAVPLVICLHGLGDNMNNFSGIGMDRIADTANFIVLTPEAVGSMLGTAWNCGASYMGNILNGNIDDVGFIKALIDSTDAKYNIDRTRIYYTGFSLGGFMCNRMACEANEEVAAIASVSGTIGTAITCEPGRSVPVCHFHGTADETINYTNNPYGMDAEDLVEFWRNNNACDSIPDSTAVEDIADDGRTIMTYHYDKEFIDKEVKFYKVSGAQHEWLFTPNNDISYTKEIWNFLRKHQIGTAGVTTKIKQSKITVAPNPANEYFNVTFKENTTGNILLFDISGKCVRSVNINSTTQKIDVRGLEKGIYILKVSGKNINYDTKIIVF